MESNSIIWLQNLSKFFLNQLKKIIFMRSKREFIELIKHSQELGDVTGRVLKRKTCSNIS